MSVRQEARQEKINVGSCLIYSPDGRNYCSLGHQWPDRNNLKNLPSHHVNQIICFTAAVDEGLVSLSWQTNGIS
ncbi:hypothetical protein MRB53_019978 [Persea americana]|uniref:Uncharacterized protein n=1 Tax=Persea americana TaxID=3435 RepID=A0ACC2KZV8_PERAE|nr:hypothetical protein MRB53_019978 [Persea americana]